ncbi:MAG: TonB-dependent receptor plug domain-containing protein, partial [Bacteroidota bacterium]|nr:TonB-dependent receptor plug domain-containing protein [Bacteroidota bacterium]
MKLSLIFLVLLLHASYSKAQTLIRIIDAESRRSLPQANIKDIVSQDIIVANAAGEAVIQVQEPTSLEISFVGYQNRLVEISENQDYFLVHLIPEHKLLDEITVIGFDSNRRLLETPASVSILQTEELFRYNESSLVPALNTIPGVRMEERAPGSYRLSIRGSLLRAPFGVRNVKVYWNDIPFTEPSGGTAINLLDLNNMGRVEVIKGPASSIYGAGTGGVVNIQSDKGQFDDNFLRASAMVGSFGLQRYSTDFRMSSENSRIAFNLTQHLADGYRDHSTLDRKTAQLFAQFFTSDRRTISANVFYSDLFYEIPGGLTEAEYLENPRQARPLSEARNASIDLQALQIGLSQEYNWNERIGNVTSIYSISSFFENPFITDYKRDASQGFGGRSRFYYNTSMGEVGVKFTAGGEFQTEKVVARNFGNVAGQPDTLRFDDELFSTQSLLFAQAEADLPANFFFTVGLSYNRLNFNIYRLTDVALNASYRIARTFDPVLAPRIGLVKKLNENMALHGSISYGFSPPTIDEVRTNEGSINEGLEAERGYNFEIGFRGNTLNNRLNFDITTYSFQLRETIVNRTDISSVVLFMNAGATSQRGVEALLNYRFVDDPGAFLALVKVQNSTTYNYYKFLEYQRRDTDFSGNFLTGVAPFVNVFTLDAALRGGFYTSWTYNYTDRIPLNDANTVYA